MKNKIIIFLLIISCNINAQQNILHITQEQAIEIGLKNRYDVQAYQYKILQAENNIDEFKKDWMPDINLNGNIKYNTQIQSTYIPAGFGGLTEPTLVAFGAKNLTIVGLELNQNIYNPAINNNIKIARNNIEMEKEKKHETEIYIKQKIAEGYLNVLLKELQLKISTGEENRYEEYYQLAKGKFDEGSLIENDLLRAKLDYENAKQQTVISKQNYLLSIDNLKYQMNVPNETIFSLCDSLNSEKLFRYELQGENFSQNRTEIKQLKLMQQANSLQLNKIRQTTLPTLSFLANYSQQYLYDNLNYFEGKWWSPFSFVGLKLNVPLSAYYKNKNNKKEFELKSSQINLDLKQKTEDINNEINKSVTEFNNAVQNVQTTKNNYELSIAIYQTQKQQYLLGSFQYSNLLDTEKSISNAEQNYIKAVYDFLIAKLNYQKAVGIL